MEIVFGQGVFGPAGLVYCCAAVWIIPLLYVGLWSLVRPISLNATYWAMALLTEILTFLIVGYFFGDLVGLIAVVLLAFSLPSVAIAGPQNLRQRAESVNITRILTFGQGAPPRRNRGAESDRDDGDDFTIDM